MCGRWWSSCWSVCRRTLGDRAVSTRVCTPAIDSFVCSARRKRAKVGTVSPSAARTEGLGRRRSVQADRLQRCAVDRVAHAFSNHRRGGLDDGRYVALKRGEGAGRGVDVQIIVQPHRCVGGKQFIKMTLALRRHAVNVLPQSLPPTHHVLFGARLDGRVHAKDRHRCLLPHHRRHVIQRFLLAAKASDRRFEARHWGGRRGVHHSSPRRTRNGHLGAKRWLFGVVWKPRATFKVDSGQFRSCEDRNHEHDRG